MITPGYIQKMAAYNAWINEGIYAACAGLSDGDRTRDRGAFFGSIHATLNHLLWGDQVWMHRLAGTDKPAAGTIAESVNQYADFDELARQRVAVDRAITAWAETVDPLWLETEQRWFSSSAGREMSNPNWVLVTHMFNHQTHHRGQVHCMLTQCGVETPTTDLPFAP